MHKIITPYCTILGITNFLSSLVKIIPTTNAPIGTRYFIQPISPPSTMLKPFPRVPVFPYISTANAKLIIIIIIACTYASCLTFFFLFPVLFFVLAVVLPIVPLHSAFVLFFIFILNLLLYSTIANFKLQLFLGNFINIIMFYK